MAGRCWQREVFPACIILRYLGQFQADGKLVKILFWRKICSCLFRQHFFFNLAQQSQARVSWKLWNTQLDLKWSRKIGNYWSDERLALFILYFPQRLFLSRHVSCAAWNLSIDGSLTENWANLISHCFLSSSFVSKAIVFLLLMCTKRISGKVVLFLPPQII